MDFTHRERQLLTLIWRAQDAIDEARDIAAPEMDKGERLIAARGYLSWLTEEIREASSLDVVGHG